MNPEDVSTRAKVAAGKMAAAVRRETLLPPDGRLCCAQVRARVNRQIGGNWHRCSKNRRPGKLTCHAHRGLEGEPTKTRPRYLPVVIDGEWFVRDAHPATRYGCLRKAASRSEAVASAAKRNAAGDYPPAPEPAASE